MNLLVSMAASVQAAEMGSSGEILMLIVWPFFGISALGLILGAMDMKKAGGILVIIGSIFFIPIGLIGVFGGKKMMSGTDNIEARRKLAEENQGIKNE